MHLPKKVQLKEVGPRDGLQNEGQYIPTEQKIQWIQYLAQTGLDYIEVTSFVHPKWIPQLADAQELLRSLKRQSGITYAALVPNVNGLERALAVDVDDVVVLGRICTRSSCATCKFRPLMEEKGQYYQMVISQMGKIRAL